MGNDANKEDGDGTGIAGFLRSGYTLVGLAALAWSWKSILVKMAYGYGLDAVTLMIMRTTPLVPAAFLALYIKEGRAGFRVSFKEFLAIALIGIVGILGSMYFSFRSLEYLDASIATLLAFVYPAFIILIQAGLEKRVRRLRLLAAAITFGGLALVLGGDLNSGNLSLTGISFGLLCALCFALNNILSERLMRGISPLKLTAWSMLIMTSCLWIMGGDRAYPAEPMPWVLALTLGFAIGLIPFLMFLHGMRRIGAGPTGLINTLGPVLTVIWAMMLLGESMQRLQFPGIALVMGGILLLRLEARLEARLEKSTRNFLPGASFRTADKKLLALLYVPVIKKRD